MREEWLRELYERYFGVINKYCLPKLGFDGSAANKRPTGAARVSAAAPRQARNLDNSGT